jgi:hypothetical protein
MSSKFLNNAVNPIAITDVIGLQDELDEIQEEIASGGGGVNFAITSDNVANGMVFRNNNDLDQIQDTDNFKLVEVLGTKLLSVPDIILPSRLFLSVGDSINANKTKLTQVSYDGTDPSKLKTIIGGELHVNKIQNTTGTAEVVLDTEGKIDIKSDDDTDITAGEFIRLITYGDKKWMFNKDRLIFNIGTNQQGGISFDDPLIDAPMRLFASNDIELNTPIKTTFTGTGGLGTAIEVYPNDQRILFKKAGTPNAIDAEIFLSIVDNTLDIVGHDGINFSALNTGSNINVYIPSGGQFLTNNNPTQPTSVMTKSAVETAIQNGQYPKVIKYRVPKLSATDVFEDDDIILRWGGSGSNSLRLTTKTAGTFNSNCVRSGTTAVQERIITSTGGSTTLNSAFAFGGGDVMTCHIQPDTPNKPSYRVTLHYTETNLVTGDIIWIVEVFD